MQCNFDTELPIFFSISDPKTDIPIVIVYTLCAGILTQGGFFCLVPITDSSVAVLLN